MNFKMPKIDIPNIESKIPSVNIPDTDIPKLPDIKNVDFNAKLEQAKGFVNTNFPEVKEQISAFESSMPNLNDVMPDMNSMMPDISLDMAAIDIPTIETAGFNVGSIDDLGIDLNSMQELGVDTSQLESQLDTSQLTSELNSFNMDDYASDLNVESMIEMPDMSPKGIMSMITGVEDPTDINSIVQNQMADADPDALKNTLISKADGLAANKIPLYAKAKKAKSKYDQVIGYVNYGQANGLDLSSPEAIMSNDYKGFAKKEAKKYIDSKIAVLEDYKAKAETVKGEVEEFMSYGDASNMDFSSVGAALHNDYLTYMRGAAKGYLNSKLDQIDETLNPSVLMGDMDMSSMSFDELVSSIQTNDPSSSNAVNDLIASSDDFKMDMSELQAMGVDTSQFNFDMNMTIPDIQTEFNFQESDIGLDMSSMEFNVTQPFRDMINKYL